MKLKIDENGHVVVVDGKPVYTDDAGKDYPMDVPQMYGKIISLTNEAKTNREAKEAAEQKLESFKDIADPVAAKKALDTVKALDDKKLVDAGKIEEVKAAAIRAAEEQAAAAAAAHATELGKVKGELDSLRSQYNSEKIGGSFKGSKFIAEKFAIPSDLVEARFGKHFKVEDGKLVATDAAGGKIYSRSKPGELADFEEAIELLVDAYPHKDAILKGSGQSGGGTPPSNGTGGANGVKKGNFGGNREERVAAIAARFPGLAQS